MTNFAHFLPVRMSYSVKYYAKLFIQEIVRFLRTPIHPKEVLNLLFNFGEVFIKVWVYR